LNRATTIMLRIGCGAVSFGVVGAWVSLGCTNFQGNKFDVPCPEDASDVENVLGEMCANNPLCVAFSAEFKVSGGMRSDTSGCHLWSHYQPLAPQRMFDAGGDGPACFTTHGTGHETDFWSMWPFMIEMGNGTTTPSCLTVDDDPLLAVGSLVYLADCDGRKTQLWYGYDNRLVPAFAFKSGERTDATLNPKGMTEFQIDRFDSFHPSNISRWYLTPLPYENVAVSMAGLQTGTIAQGFLQSEDLEKERCLVSPLGLRDGCHDFHPRDDIQAGWTLRWAMDAHKIVV